MNDGGRRTEDIGLFFFLAFLDENLATQAIHRCLDLLESQSQRSTENFSERVLVQAMSSAWSKLEHKLNRGGTGQSLGRVITLNNEMDLAPWREFQKTAEVEEIHALLWSQILRFDDEEIATGLAISIGTLRHRVSRGLRKLGAITRPGCYQGAY